MKKKFILVMMFIIAFAFGQDYDSLHKLGKELYINGDPSEALEVYQQILNKYPDDVDALLYRGRLFARLELYDLAEKELLRTLELAPDYMDAYYALASVYYWSGQLDKARDVLTVWLTKDLKNPDAYLLSARVAIADRHYAAARTFLEQAEYFGTDPELIKELFSRLNAPLKSPRWETGLNYEYLAVDQGAPDWQQVGIHMAHNFGSFYFNLGMDRYFRNNSIDHSITLDTYYKLWQGSYMNTRIQTGLNWIFIPRVDVTAEVFQAVGRRQEPSLGYRVMYFGTVTAHIPSIAWAMYPGNWYVREKVSMIINNGISWQNQLIARYYLGDVDTYLQLMNVVGTDFNVIDNNWVNSLAFALSGSYALSEHWLLNGVASWTRDESGLNRAGGSLGLAYRW